MKKTYFILFSVLTLNINSQWVNQSVIPDPPALFSTYAYNSLIAWACGDSGKVLYTSNGGTNWIYKDSTVFSQQRVFSIHALSQQIALCVCNISGNGKIFKTTNAGTSWIQKYSRNGVFLNDIEFMNTLTGFVYGNPVGNFWFILKTTDGGETYDSTSISRPIPLTPNDIGFPNDHVVIDNAGQAFIWFGSNTPRVYFSTNSGAVWNNSQTPANPFVFCLTFLNIQTGFAGGQDAFKSTNGGVIWNPIVPPPPGAGPFMSFANIAGFVWYSRGPCIYYSTNTGASFIMQHCSPTGSIYNHMSFTLAVGDNPMSVITGWGVTGDGVISKYTDITGIEKIGTTIPDEFKLEQNYPNPFNPKSTIKYQIAKSSLVTLKVFDILGREAAELVNQKQEAGSYNITFDASGLASGVYFYSLYSDGVKIDSKKMVLIK